MENQKPDNERVLDDTSEDGDLGPKQTDTHDEPAVEGGEEPSLWAEISFSFPKPPVILEKGAVEKIPWALNQLSPDLPDKKLMVVIGGNSLKESGTLDRVLKSCSEASVETAVFSVGSGEATAEKIDEGVNFVLREKPHFIAGIGGGAVLDSAKAIAGIAANGGAVRDYHDGKQFELPGAPFIAVPTTAGTGSEVTPNSVIIDATRGFKKSIRGQNIIAGYIILDPELTVTCPQSVTAYSGADAFVQAIEAFVSKNSNPLSDIYAMQAITLISKNLIEVYENGSNYDARAQMLMGSYFAAVAFSNVGLGLVHGLAHPLGFRYNIPHGKICGTLLPWVIEYNMEIRAEKYALIAKELAELDLFSTYQPEAPAVENARRLAAMLKEFLSRLQVPLRLQDLGVAKEDFDWIIENTKGGSVNANPRTPDPESLRELLETAW